MFKKCFLNGFKTDSVQFSSVAQSCPTLCNPMDHSTPGLPVHHQLLELPKLMSIELVMPSSHLILCCPLLLLPPIPPSIRVFSNESTLRMRWPKYWSFSLYHYMQNLKNNTNKSINRTETDLQMQKINLCLPKRGKGGGINQEYGINRYKLHTLCSIVSDSL